MKYTALIEADGASVPQIEAAKAAYLNTLSERLGGAEEVLKCWRAYARGMESGIRTLNDENDRAAAAWVLADSEAKKAAILQLQGTRVVSINFALTA